MAGIIENGTASVQRPSPPPGGGGWEGVRFIDPDGCAYQGYGSLADIYYRPHITDPYGHDGHLTTEGTISIRMSEGSQAEFNALIEWGQSAGDDFHGGGSNDIAATIWGCSNFTGDIDSFEQWLKNEVMNMTVSMLGGTPEQRDYVEKTLKDPDYLQTGIEYLGSGSPTLIIIHENHPVVDPNTGKIKSNGNLTFGSLWEGSICLAPINFYTGNKDAFNGLLLGTTLAHETRHAYNRSTGKYTRWENAVDEDALKIFDEYSAQSAGMDYYNYYRGSYTNRVLEDAYNSSWYEFWGKLDRSTRKHF